MTLSSAAFEKLSGSADEAPYTDFSPTWRNRAETAISHGALTNSKRPRCFVDGIYPTHVSRGRGPYVWDAEGKLYVDYIMGLGSTVLGYADTEIGEAISKQWLRGATLSLSTDLEVEVAERVKELFPFIDRVRFLKTGSDACSAAVRIARTATGRRRVLSSGYHGWHDEFVSMTPPACGVTGSFDVEPFREISQINSETAAVIVEPILLDASDERRKWLGDLRAACTAAGAMLIFDEVITGFRVPALSVSTMWGVHPDLACFGKAIASGMPLSVVGGRKEVMECGEYFVSSTFAGETLSLAAARETIRLLTSGKYEMELLWTKGRRFADAVSSLFPGLRITGYPTRGVFEGDPEMKALVWQESCRAGVLFGASWFYTFAHISEDDAVLNTLNDISIRIKTGSVKLIGKMPESPFAQKVRSA